jgi:tripartite-type tricarboxylate transporter receptor subunit TctC
MTILRKSSALLLAALLGCSALAQAQGTFPNRPVRWVVPFPPGGSSEAMSRIIANRLKDVWGQPVIVENKPGAGTVIGTDAVAKAAPDGHVLGLVITSHVINPSMRKLPYDTLKDLTGVTQLAMIYLAIMSNPSVPATTVPELIAYSKANPGKVTFGTAGAGTSAHLFGEMMNIASGSSFVHVGYKGSGPAATDLMGGRLDLLIDPLASQSAMVTAGKMKMLAFTSAKRNPQFPQFPVVAETLPGVSVESFFGIVVPSATPKDLVAKLNKDIVEALNYPEVRERIVQIGLVPVGSSSAEFDGMVRDEIKKWAKVVEVSGAKIE